MHRDPKLMMKYEGTLITSGERPFKEHLPSHKTCLNLTAFYIRILEYVKNLMPSSAFLGKYSANIEQLLPIICYESI
jgi:hypothetical protein